MLDTTLLYIQVTNRESPQLVCHAFVLPDRIEICLQQDNNAQPNRHKHIIDTLDTSIHCCQTEDRRLKTERAGQEIVYIISFKLTIFYEQLTSSAIIMRHSPPPPPPPKLP